MAFRPLSAHKRGSDVEQFDAHMQWVGFPRRLPELGHPRLGASPATASLPYVGASDRWCFQTNSTRPGNLGEFLPHGDASPKFGKPHQRVLFDQLSRTKREGAANFELSRSASDAALFSCTKLFTADSDIGCSHLLPERRAGRGWHRVGSPARIEAPSRVRQTLESPSSRRAPWRKSSPTATRNRASSEAGTCRSSSPESRHRNSPRISVPQNRQRRGRVAAIRSLSGIGWGVRSPSPQSTNARLAEEMKTLAPPVVAADEAVETCFETPVEQIQIINEPDGALLQA